MTVYHTIEDIKIGEGKLSLVVDGQLIAKRLSDISPLLGSASEAALGNYEVSPAGYGIHWPLIDEDISIDGLLGITHSPVQWKKSA